MTGRARRLDRRGKEGVEHSHVGIDLVPHRRQPHVGPQEVRFRYVALLTVAEVSGEVKIRRGPAGVDLVDQLLKIDGRSGRGLLRRRGGQTSQSVVTWTVAHDAVLPGVISRAAVH